MSADKYNKQPDFKTLSDALPLSKASSKPIESRDLFAALAMHALLHQGIAHDLACVQAWSIASNMVKHAVPL